MKEGGEKRIGSGDQCTQMTARKEGLSPALPACVVGGGDY